jgi:N-acetyl-alpha-D-muramate 1-phosphate uridylyltransferase
MLPVAILAGGLATRLRPITETIPKALVDVAGKPFIVRQLEYLRAQGLTRIALCVGYLGGQIESLIGDGRALGLDVVYSYDGPRLLGTGGALRRALSLLGDRFLVMYGDSWLPIDFRAVERSFVASKLPALMAVLHNGDRWDKSNVLFRDGRIIEYNKRSPRPEMAYIDYGVGALSASMLAGYADDQVIDLADIYHALSLRGDLAGLEVTERFYEIGSHEGLDEAIAFFNKGKNA